MFDLGIAGSKYIQGHEEEAIFQGHEEEATLTTPSSWEPRKESEEVS